MEQKTFTSFQKFFSNSTHNSIFNVKKNFPNFIRIFIVGLTIVFIAGINVFFSSNVVNKHFHSSLTTEQIDGTTNTFTGVKSQIRQSRILNSVADDIQSSTRLKHDTKRAFKKINQNKFFPEQEKSLFYQKSSNVLSTRKAQPIKPKELDDIIITVKTTKKNHRSRLVPIINTWFQYSPSQIYFITEEKDELISKITGRNI